MKKLISTLTILLSGIMIFTSCHNENMNLSVNGTGEIRLSSMTMSYNTEPIVKESRAAEDLNEYTVGIYNFDDNTLVQEWKYTEMPELFVLPVGNYKIVAHSPEVEGADFDAPFCYGESKKIEVKKDNVSDVGEVLCVLKSIKVTIVFAEDLMPHISDDTKVTVTIGEESLEYKKDNTKSGFFHGTGESTLVDVKFTGTVEGEDTKITTSYNVAEGTEIIVKYTWESVSVVDPGTGGMIPSSKITVNEEILGVEDLDGIILPGNDGILDFGLPTIEGVGFDINQPLINPAVVQVNLKAPEGMAHVNVTITSTDTSFEDAVKEIFGANTFDLAEPGSLEETLKEFGFPVGDEIVGNRDVVLFDVTKFMEPLALFNGEHTFNIVVKDKYNNPEENADKNLVIIMK